MTGPTRLSVAQQLDTPKIKRAVSTTAASYSSGSMDYLQ